MTTERDRVWIEIAVDCADPLDIGDSVLHFTEEEDTAPEKGYDGI